jgi:hypothetical protein
MVQLNKDAKGTSQKLTEYIDIAKPMLKCDLVVHGNFGKWLTNHLASNNTSIIESTLFVMAELKKGNTPEKILSEMHHRGHDITNIDAVVNAVNHFSPKGEAFSMHYWEIKTAEINKSHLRG